MPRLLFCLLLMVDCPGFAFDFTRQINPFPVRDMDGQLYPYAFCGGFNRPRPQWVDIDGDHDFDLFIQDQIGRLMFFENTGTPQAAHFVWRSDNFFDFDIGSWYKFADADGDGDADADLFTANQLEWVRYYRNDGDVRRPQFSLLADKLQDAAGNLITAENISIPELADIDCDGDLDLFLGRQTGAVTFYTQTGLDAVGAPRYHFVTDAFEDILIISGGRAEDARHGANSPSFADIDGDHDLDLFWGDFFSGSLYFLRNDGVCAEPVIALTDRIYPPDQPLETGGYNVPRFVDLDADGDLDMFVAVLGGAFSNTRNMIDNLYYFRNDGAKTQPVFHRQTSRYLFGIDVGQMSVPLLFDADSDGDLDAVLGSEMDAATGLRGQLLFFLNEGTSKNPAWRLADPDYLALNIGFSPAPAAADLDGDHDLDLLIGEWNGNLNYFENIGTAATPRFILRDERVADIDVGNNSAPALADLDGDGDLDLLAGEFSGNLNFYRNAGTAAAPDFVRETEMFLNADVGNLSKPHLVDIDADLDFDLLIGGEESGLLFYRNFGDAQTADFRRDATLQLAAPLNAAPFLVDIDNDSDLDFFCGGQRGGLIFYENRAGSNAIEDDPKPAAFFCRNYPNPFHESTSILLPPAFLRTQQALELTVYDVAGRLVYRRRVTPAADRLDWRGVDNQGWLAPSGIYTYRIHHPGDYYAQGTMVILR